MSYKLHFMTRNVKLFIGQKCPINNLTGLINDDQKRQVKKQNN
jgi:hypothetical protein